MRKTSSIALSTILLVGVLFASCDQFNAIRGISGEKEEKVVAKVGKKVLYDKFLPSSLKQSKDSTQLIADYVDSWIYYQVMEQKAQNFLPSGKLEDLNQKMLDYKATLFAYEYEKELIHQKVSIDVNEEEAYNYYEANKKGFTAPQNLIKGRYFFMENSVSQADSIKTWFENNNLEALEKNGYQFASQFKLESEWFLFDDFQARLPEKIEDPKEFLRKNRFVEIKDNKRTCLLFIEDFRRVGEIIPFEFKEQDIKRIIINKRREEYLNKIKNDIKREANENGYVENF